MLIFIANTHFKKAEKSKIEDLWLTLLTNKSSWEGEFIQMLANGAYISGM